MGRSQGGHFQELWINHYSTLPSTQDDGGFPITGYKIDMLDIQTNNWIEITFIEVPLPVRAELLMSRGSSRGAPSPIFSTESCTGSGEFGGVVVVMAMVPRVIAYNDAGPSEAGEPSEPVVIDVPGVQVRHPQLSLSENNLNFQLR